MKLHHVFHYPKKIGNYNFVQILIDFKKPKYREYPVLVFPENEKTHGEILEKFLKKMNFHHPYFNNGRKIIPNLIGKDYSVVGIGEAYFNGDFLEIRKAKLDNDYGSVGIEVGVNKEHLEKIKKYSTLEYKII
jgi:hypothetical protein